MKTRRGHAKFQQSTSLEKERTIDVESVVISNDDEDDGKGQCFVCGKPELASEYQARRLYKQQTTQFKHLVLSSELRKKISPPMYNKFSTNIRSCSSCLAMIKEVWTLHQEIISIQGELDKLVENARENIAAEYVLSQRKQQTLISPIKPGISKSPKSASPRTCQNIKIETKDEVVSDNTDTEYSMEFYPEVDQHQDDDVYIAPVKRITRSLRQSKRTPSKNLASRSSPRQRRNGHSNKYKEVDNSDDEDESLKSKSQKKFQEHSHQKVDGKFNCSNCGKAFGLLNRLVYHEVLVCNIQYEESKLEELQIKFHPCDLCDRKFAYNSDLIRHGLLHTGDQPSKCPGCGSSYRTKYEEEKYCKKCKGKLLTTRPSDGNENEPDIKNIKDKSPNAKETVDLADSDDDVGNKTKKIDLKCSKCGKVLGKHGSLIFHEITVCGIEYSDEKLRRLNVHLHACETCDRKFLYAKDLKRHMQTHIGVLKLWKCEKCGKSFSQSCTLSQHQRIYCEAVNIDPELRKKVHEKRLFNLSQLIYKCPKCSKRYASVAKLTTHLKAHELSPTSNQSQKILCDICGISLNQSALGRHVLRVHEKKLNVFCSQCGKGFFENKDLKMHIRNVHMDKKNQEKHPQKIKCNQCGKSYHHDGLMHHRKNVHLKIRSMKKRTRQLPTTNVLSVARSFLTSKDLRPTCRKEPARAGGGDNLVKRDICFPSIVHIAMKFFTDSGDLNFTLNMSTLITTHY
ncbi:zinc finger protein 91 isoform X3 [Folsomia candida]|uniref:zinc finger protein 91 isoform X3 n=1 Tax=Folsomia candida TaxID=158441 RepID=UPI000B8F335E|nr:zinc finger protein 91 isoform X3 [Folsomia candida]